MAITPQDIEQQVFSAAPKGVQGYATEEVDAFLEEVASEVDAMLKKIADLKSRLNASEQQLSQAQAQVQTLEGELKDAASAGDKTQLAAPVAAPAQDDLLAPSQMAASERQISQVLIVAQQSADKLIAEAKDNAERIKNEADQKAREVIRQALAEKQHELDQIDHLKSSREEFKAAYKKMLQHFMDDAESVFDAAAVNAPAPQIPASVVSSSVNVSAVQAPAAPVNPVAPAQSAPVSQDFGDLD